MVERKLEVRNEEGLHTRPANQFVKIVKEHESAVTLTKDGTTVPGKSLLKLMKLGIVTGDVVTISCDGADEDATMADLTALVQPGEQ